ncbi:MAG: beta-ketoacyl-[acyl-carrier-protein] synthase family protein [candidate division NC10 bacterium]|nr:beta-ketoacyl-[acyl-carrier-protein] synthase family protein [candidate division NC10 bacterium]
MERPRVVITGMGVVTPIGIGVEMYWRAALAGVSGVGLITHFDASGLPSRMAAYVKDEEALGRLRSWLGLRPEEPRSVLFALAAARMACEAAGWLPEVKGNDRAGVFFGTYGQKVDVTRVAEIAYRSRGRVGREIHLSACLQAYCRSMDGAQLTCLLPQYVTHRLAQAYHITGPSCTIQTACTTSAQAVGEAYRSIERGTVDLAICGGSDCVVLPIQMLMFCLLGVLSRRNHEPERASRPFDLERDGFVLGEGAGVLILERLERALERGAPILAELKGYGTSCDAYRVTDEAPDGRGAILAIRRALADAGLSPEDVDYVNAHGTSTSMNDRVETAVLKAVLGKKAYQVPVSSTKSMIGHTISAAGVIELITCVLARRDQVVPPTINYEYPDPECDLDYVPNVARPHKVEVVLSNSFGFGGHNDCLVVTKFSP